MVGEISHVVYAARLLSHLKDKVSHSSYWVGALFPNVKHVGAQSRHPTHPHPVALSSLVGPTDFATGMRVHAWIDATREQYMRRRDVAEMMPLHPLAPYALRLLEDEQLYGAYNDWEAVRKALCVIHPDELKYIHERTPVLAWHNILQAYFSESPSDTSRVTFSRAIGLSHASAEEINSLVHEMRSSRDAQAVLRGFVHELEHILV